MVARMNTNSILADVIQLPSSALSGHSLTPFLPTQEDHSAAYRHLEERVLEAERWKEQGKSYLERKLFVEAAQSYQNAITLNPSDADAQCCFAHICVQMRDVRRAITHYNQAIKLKPDYTRAYTELAFLLMEHQNHLMAEKLLQMARQISPKDTFLVYAQTILWKETGRIAEAQKLCEMTLADTPGSAVIFCALARIRKFTPEDAEVKYMEARLGQEDAQMGNAITIALELAQIYERDGNTAKAFHYYTLSTRFKATGSPFDEKKWESYFIEMKKVFSTPQHPVIPATSSQFPVFILGMPRSGTTLIEQILDTHPQASGAGELTTLNDFAHFFLPQEAKRAFPLCIPFFDTEKQESYEKIAAQYREVLYKHSPMARCVCDKMPHNFLLVGLIMRLFPDAKIIHCRRDAMDTCFSIYCNYFNGTHEYGYDLGTLGRYYRWYDDLMQHWEKIYPGHIHTVQYETMVTDFEPTARALVKYCGLPWDDACLNYHTNTRSVRTLSKDQVRQPIYTSSIGRWKQYKNELAPLKEALGDLAAA